MDDVARLQPVAPGDLCISGCTAVQQAGFGKQFRPCGAVNGPINPTASQQRGIGGIDNCVHIQSGNIRLYDLYDIHLSTPWFPDSRMALKSLRDKTAMSHSSDQSYEPVSGMDVPRFAGVATFMRLPLVDLEAADDIDIGLVGIPWDGGTTNRPGPRHGPRQMRDMSAMTRRVHHFHKMVPYELANFADLGDAPVNPADVTDALDRIEGFYAKLTAKGIRPLSAGGDHLCSLPVLRALGKQKPVGMVHFDAHSDLWDSYFGGFKFTHGTPFARAIEEGVLDPKRTVQIGLRGGVYDWEDRDFGAKHGVRMIDIEEFHDLGIDETMRIAREVVGGGETYVSFDIDCLDPAFAPGTGTPEIGGFTNREAQFMLRKLMGLNVIGADVVEVSPPFDPSGYTALNGVTMMWELMCVMARDVANRKA